MKTKILPFSIFFHVKCERDAKKEWAKDRNERERRRDFD